jgi:hypothetical protein
LVLDITFVDFVFCIVLHGSNLLPSGFALQARNIQSNLFLTAPSRCNKRAWGASGLGRIVITRRREKYFLRMHGIV